MKMFGLRLRLLVCVNLFLYLECSIPMEKLCVSPSCKEPISKAQGSVKYMPPSNNMLAFERGQEIMIIGKSKNVDDYWEAVIDGKIGYVSSKLIKEVKVFHRMSDLISVPVQLQQKNESKGEDSNSTLSQVSPEEKTTGTKTQPSVVQTPSNLHLEPTGSIGSPSQTFNVIEGTTIYEDISPSSTVEVKTTVQTATGEVHKDERATLPPEIIKLNDNYKGQLSLKDKVKIIDEKNNDNVKIESKDLYEGDEEEEEEEEENEYEEEGEEEEEEEEVGEKEKEEDETLEEKEMVKNETETEVERVDDGEEKAAAVLVEKVSSQVNVNVDVDGGKIEKVEEVSVTLPLQEEVVQISPGPPSGWNLLNNFKATPPPVEANKPLEDPLKKSMVSQVDQSIMVDVNQSQGITTEAVSTPHAVAQDAASTRFSPSSPQLVTQDFAFSQKGESSKETPPPAVAQNTILSQFTASADTPPENTYHLEPKIEEITTEAAPATPQPVPGTMSGSEVGSLTDAPVEKENEEFRIEVTTETFATSQEPVVPETSTLGKLLVPTDDRPTSEQPADEKSAPEIIQEKVEVQTENTPQVMEVPKPTEIPEVQVGEPAVESIQPQAMVEDKVEIKEESASLSESGEDSGLTSQITRTFSSWFTPTSQEQLPGGIVRETQSFEGEDSRERVPDDVSSGTCEGGLGFECKDFTGEEQSSTWISWITVGLGADSLSTSSNTFLYLVVTAVTVLLFTLGHNFIEKRGKTGPLIAKINKLEQELLVASKECSLLKDEVQASRDKITLYENSANDELVISLQAELEESKRVKAELESSVEVLQQELDAATEAGLDLNKMLSEVLTQKGGSETLLKSVENLQSQLDRQQRVIDEMTKKLGAKNQENEALQSALEAANEKSENLEEQLNEIKHNLNLHLKEKENLTQDLNSQITQLKARINQLGQAKEKEIAQVKKESEAMQKKLTETTGALTAKEEELKSLKEAVKKLKTKQDVKLDVVFDVCKVTGELAKEKKDSRVLAEKLQKEEASNTALAENVKILDAETQKLKKAYEEAEQKRDEAEKKLEVLSTYFKEKETQLQKELGLQEALWAQKKGDEKAVYNMMKSLQEEVESYKSQNETLKKEILDQERGLKSQMATLEQKAHENWVAARQAERKLEEAKQEMGQLRNRLTLAEKNSNNAEGKSNFRSSEELNGVEAASPILHDTSSPLLFPPLPLDPANSNLLPPGFMPHPMFMPPPMSGFIPPPPFLPGDRRPPPLGRMSSPPLNNRFSPSSPADYPFERMPSPPLSPSSANYRSPNEDRDRYTHRSPPYPPPPPLHPRNWDDSNEKPGFIPISSPRNSRRDHKGSNISSEHSSSESLDKSSRHSGRV